MERDNCEHIVGVTFHYDGDITWHIQGEKYLWYPDTHFDFCPNCGKDLRKEARDD